MVTLPGKASGSALLWRSALRYAMQHRWQTGLNILGILIGVMMVVAVDLANNSAREAFDTSIDMLNGSITHQVVGGSEGIPDLIFTRLKTELGIRKAAPSLSGQVRVSGKELTVIGIDVISEAGLQRQRPGLPRNAFAFTGNLIATIGSADRVVMIESLARSLGIQVNDSFNAVTFNGTSTATLAAVFELPESEVAGDVILADMAAAQNLLGRTGMLDSIDLILDDNEAGQLRNWLPASLALVDAQARNDSVQQMSDAFHINLLAMSLLSLLVAGLLIYNTVTLSVLQRQKTLGIFRAQGLTRRQVFALVMVENGVIGLLASLLGVAAGFLLGRFLVTMVTGTVDALYFDLLVTTFFLDPLILVKGIGLGVLLSLVSAVLPAWHAARSKPVTLQHHAAQGNEWHSKLPWLALAGIVLMGLGWVMLLPDYGSLVTGFIALTFIVFGFCLLVPLCLFLLLTALLKIGGSNLSLSGLMAMRNASSSINRTGLAVAALCVAVSVTVGVGVMVGSFRGTVILWLEQSLPGDIQLIALSGPAASNGFPASLRDDLTNMVGITGLHDAVLVEVESEFGPIRLGVNDISGDEKFYMKDLVPGGFTTFDLGEGVFVSEPLAYLQTLELNDSISVLTDEGLVAFPILGIFYDYTSGIGMVQMQLSLYTRHWDLKPATRLSLDLAPGVDQSILLPVIEQSLAAYDSNFNLISNSQLRTLTLQIFDRTFAITNVLRLLAILVAFVGVVSTLMALQLEKAREFAILRATGMTPKQTSGLILKQTTLLGVCSGLLALPLGLLMSNILIDVINRRSFGWTMQHFLPPSVLLEGFVLAVVAALLAGLYPAWRASRIRPALALREE